ncbi:MAG: hypothetical protein PHD48_03995 [Alphaproteobacteria bacterium]|nr:hypothetical protein [Alphaproteobacteria bacterium]
MNIKLQTPKNTDSSEGQENPKAKRHRRGQLLNSSSHPNVPEQIIKDLVARGITTQAELILVMQNHKYTYSYAKGQVYAFFSTGTASARTLAIIDDVCGYSTEGGVMPLDRKLSGRSPVVLSDTNLSQHVVEALARKGIATQKDLVLALQLHGYKASTATSQISKLCSGRSVSPRVQTIINVLTGDVSAETGIPSFGSRGDLLSGSKMSVEIIQALAERGIITQRDLRLALKGSGYSESSLKINIARLCHGEDILRRLAIAIGTLTGTLPEGAMPLPRQKVRMAASAPKGIKAERKDHRSYIDIIKSAFSAGGLDVQLQAHPSSPKGLRSSLGFTKPFALDSYRTLRPFVYERLDSQAEWKGDWFRFDVNYRTEVSKLPKISHEVEKEIGQSIRCETEAMIEAFCSIPASLRAIRSLYQAFVTRPDCLGHVAVRYIGRDSDDLFLPYQSDLARSKFCEIVELCDDLLTPEKDQSVPRKEIQKKLVKEISRFYPLTEYWREMRQSLKGYVACQELRQKYMGDDAVGVSAITEDIGMPVQCLASIAGSISERMDSIQGLKSHLVKVQLPEIRDVAVHYAQTHDEALCISSLLVSKIIHHTDRWDYTKDGRLMPFVQKYIVPVITEAFLEESLLPVAISQHHFRIAQAQEKIFVRQGPHCSREELAAETKLTPRTLAVREARNMEFIPINQVNPREYVDHVPLDLTSDPAMIFEKTDLDALVNRIVQNKAESGLTDREVDVLCYRFGCGHSDGEPMTLRAVSNKIKVSYELVRLDEDNAQRKLRTGPLRHVLYDLCYG